MIVAEIQMSIAPTFAHAGFILNVRFSDLEMASNEYARLAELLQRREDKANDVPKTVDCEGVNKVTVKLQDIASVGLVDHAKTNAELIGWDDTFPLLAKHDRRL